MPLSTYNAGLFFAVAARDVKSDIGQIPEFERWNLVNRVVRTVSSEFYSLFYRHYMTPVVLVSSQTGKYYVSSASWAASTSELTATMNTDFTDGDVGKYVVFRIGTSVYDGIITSMVSSTKVIVSCNNPPQVNNTVNDVLVVATVWNADGISIASLPVMRSADIHIHIESSATDFIGPVPIEELRVFTPLAQQSKNRIAWCLSGDLILMRKGSSLTSYGTLILRYPRVPITVTGVSSVIDLPDGAVMETAITLAKKKIAERYGGVQKDYRDEISALVGSIYQNYGLTMNAEEIKKKVEAMN